MSWPSSTTRPPPSITVFLSVGAISGEEGRQIELLDGVEDEPREVVLRQPVAQARRQQQLLLAIARDEVLPHHEMVLNRADDNSPARSSGCR